MNGHHQNDKSPLRQLVRRVAVLGAGTMGSQIAALLAHNGIHCDLLDLEGTVRNRNFLAEEGKKGLLTMKPSPLPDREALDLIDVGNLADDLPRLNDVDWVIEAVVEKLHVKRQLWSQVAKHVKRSAILSTNTSAIPIHSISQALPKHLQARFVGTHFFNPPRYLKLLEIIPSLDTDPDVVHDVRRFSEHVLERNIVMAKDVPGFITNRLGCYIFLATMNAMDEFGFEPDEVDAITGPAMGRPKSATFRTLDLVGLDVFVDICDNIRASVSERWEQDAFAVPSYLRDMLNKGWKGVKSGQGFYKRIEGIDDGKSEILALQIELMGYLPQQHTVAESLSPIRRISEPDERITQLVNRDDTLGEFAWRVLSQALVYAARKADDVADDITSIDQAMKWGFGWSMGPFEIWQALGIDEATSRMVEGGLEVPDWVKELASNGGAFYDHVA